MGEATGMSKPKQKASSVGKNDQILHPKTLHVWQNAPIIPRHSMYAVYAYIILHWGGWGVNVGI